MNKQKGFTIIELIVVIAIIAILAGIVLVNVSGYLNKSKDAAMIEEMHTLQTDAIANVNSSGIYPVTATLCATSAGNGFGAEWGAITSVYTATAVTACSVNSVANTDGSAVGTKWCACVKEFNAATTYWCIDSTGYAGPNTSSGSASDCHTVCSGTSNEVCTHS